MKNGDNRMTFDFQDGNGPVPAHQHPNGGGWVADTASVADTAYIGSDARVYGNAQVYGNARIYGNARVCGDANVFGNAEVSGNANVFGNAKVFGNARVSSNAWVFGNARVCDNAVVYGNVMKTDVINNGDNKMTKKETATQRRAREAQEAQLANQKWEAEKSDRLLRALAWASDLNMLARVYHRYDNIMYYEFRFDEQIHDVYHDPVAELSDHMMTLIESRLQESNQQRVKQMRLVQLREDVISRLSDEELEALGLV
jgi:carbonic anhydrase/acetyltransferase-like protein (isoleucine patch superfamily)